MDERKLDSKKAEILAIWYLRFNGYFTVDSYTLHASDVSDRIRRDKVRNLTEIDILGIRHKFNKEMPGVRLQNDDKILHPEEPFVDFIIAEVKTGNERGLNTFWNRKNDKNEIPKLVADIEYILGFAGFIKESVTVNEAANEIARRGLYLASDKTFGIRLVLISEKEANQNWKNITNVLLNDVIDFFVEKRNCWSDEGIAFASIHCQWNPLINKIFEISNNQTLNPDLRKQKIRELLQEDTKEDLLWLRILRYLTQKFGFANRK